jgi:hypothetical protein
VSLKPSSSVLRFVNLFGAALLTGGLIVTVAAMRPALAGLPVSIAVLAQHSVVRWASFYMPICGALTAISAVLLIKRRVLTRASARFYIIGVGCMIPVGLTSIYVGGVLDKEIAAWPFHFVASERSAHVSFADRGAPASRRMSVWKTWGALNAARTGGAVIALICFIMANLQPRVLEQDD